MTSSSEHAGPSDHAAPAGLSLQTDEAKATVAEIKAENLALKERLSRELLRRGVLTNLSAKMYLSIAHTDRVLDQTIAVFADSLESAVSG